VSKHSDDSMTTLFAGEAKRRIACRLDQAASAIAGAVHKSFGACMAR